MLPVETDFLTQKSTHQAQAVIMADHGWCASLQGQTVTGYEIHMGQTVSLSAWLHIQRQDAPVADGAMTEDGQVWGCYLHGLFANDNLRRAWLRSLGWQPDDRASFSLQAAFDHLADIVEAHLDMQRLEQIMGSP